MTSWSLRLLNDRCPHPFINFNTRDPYPFLNQKPEKGTPLGRSLPVENFTGSTPSPVLMGVFLTIFVCDDNNGGTAYTKELADSLQFNCVVSVLRKSRQVHEQIIGRQSYSVPSDWYVIISKFI